MITAVTICYYESIENCVDYATWILQFSICLTALKYHLINAVIHNQKERFMTCGAMKNSFNILDNDRKNMFFIYFK